MHSNSIVLSKGALIIELNYTIEQLKKVNKIVFAKIKFACFEIIFIELP